MSNKVNLVQEKSIGNNFSLPRKKLKIALMMLLVTIVFFMYKSPDTFIILDEITTEDSEYYNQNVTKNILFWTRFFGHHNWYAEEDGTAGEAILKSINCPVTNCFFTHDRNYLSNQTDFDAILIHGPEIMQGKLPPFRSPHQLFVFVSLEAPTFVYEDLNFYKNYYNITMTYRMDSDVEWDYGKILSAETNEVIAPSKSPKWKTPDENFFDENYLKIYQNKTKSIAWFVSNCNAFNKRQDLVKKMQEHIDIDIYGRCGNLTCAGPECENMLTNTYKFYLSFENSLCKDYVTEKLYRPLYEYSIPLVFNGAKDKTFFAPPKSYIDVEDYANVEDLVKYLKYLMDNPREYIKYFWWKKFYVVKPHPVYPYTHCELCKKLNDKNFMTTKHQFDDINAWFRDNMCNQTARIKF